MHLDDSLGRCKALEYTCFLHEQALAIAAEAYAQFTNFPGVGVVTSGPGSTNAITGVAAAYIDSTPCVFISGQAKRSDLKGRSGVRQMGSQEVDIVSMVSCITKYAVTVLEPNEIRYHLEKAWHGATTGRMGPVWIDIPLDVQAELGAQLCPLYGDHQFENIVRFMAGRAPSDPGSSPCAASRSRAIGLSGDRGQVIMVAVGEGDLAGGASTGRGVNQRGKQPLAVGGRVTLLTFTQGPE